MAPTATLRRSLSALVAVFATSCGDAPLDRNAAGGYPNHNAPAGRIEGTILYEGPAPTLDASGRAQGRIVLLLFRADESPPPDGFATTPVALAVVPASQVFQSATALPGGNVRATSRLVSINDMGPTVS